MKRIQARSCLLSITGSLLAGLLMASPALSQERFIPSEIDVRQGPSPLHFKTLDNRELSARAAQLRDSSLSASQRAMNYQWLSEHSGSESAIHGKRAVSKLFQRSLKGYWNRKRDEHFGDNTLVPDSEGRGSVSSSFNYDVHVSSDELELGIVYEF